jgi:hypothetical protein
MGVINGSPVDASNTNSAFINKNQADSMPYNLQFAATTNYPQNVIATSGTITDLDSEKTYVKLTGATVLSGITAGRDGQVIIVANGTAGVITLENEAGGATAADRLSIGTDLPLLAGTSVFFVYDDGASRWVFCGGSTSGGITELTGDVSASGPGSAVATVDFVGGYSAADINTNIGAVTGATDLNVASRIVKRDASGNFAAGTITATSVKADSSAGLDLKNSSGTTVLNLGPGPGTGATFTNGVQMGSAILNGSVSGSVTHHAAATTTSYDVYWPSVQGASGSFPRNDGSGNLTWTTSTGGTAIYTAAYYASTGGTSSTATPINFDTQVYDANGLVTTGAAWKFTAPVAGKAVVKSFAQSGTANDSYVAVYKNGSKYKTFAYCSDGTSVSLINGEGFTVPLSAGDYFDIRTLDSMAWTGNATQNNNAASWIDIEFYSN